jgi:hypothetical protein
MPIEVDIVAHTDRLSEHGQRLLDNRKRGGAEIAR